MSSATKSFVAITGCVVVLVGCAFYVIRLPGAAVEAIADTAGKLSRDMQSHFGFVPTIKAKDAVIIHSQTPIFELVTASQSYKFSREWRHTWLGSSKVVTATASYTAKAGFDLHENFELDVDGDMVTITTPRAKILSVEQATDFEVIGAGGWWNGITDAERAEVINGMTAGARQIAETGELPKFANQSLRDNLGEILYSRLGKQARIVYR